MLKQGRRGIIVSVMALIVLNNNKRKFVSPEEGSRLWLVKTGEKRGSARDRAYVKRIEKIYLNRNNAPDSYLLNNPDPREQRPAVPYVRLPYID